MPGGKSIFNVLWLDKLEYKDWLLQHENKHKAKCSVCNKEIDVANLGETAISRHMEKGKFYYYYFLIFIVDPARPI